MRKILILNRRSIHSVQGEDDGKRDQLTELNSILKSGMYQSKKKNTVFIMSILYIVIGFIIQMELHKHIIVTYTLPNILLRFSHLNWVLYIYTQTIDKITEKKREQKKIYIRKEAKKILNEITCCCLND